VLPDGGELPLMPEYGEPAGNKRFFWFPGRKRTMADKEK
jgi:hypothetical protein